MSFQRCPRGATTSGHGAAVAPTRASGLARVGAVAAAHPRAPRAAECGGSGAAARSVRCDCSSSGTDDKAPYAGVPGAGMGFGTGRVDLPASTLHPEWIEMEADKAPMMDNPGDPYGPDSLTHSLTRSLARSLAHSLARSLARAGTAPTPRRSGA